MRKRNNSGLSLPELVISLAILFFAMLSLLRFSYNTCRVELRSKDKTTAVKLSQKIMEEQIYKCPCCIYDISFSPVPDNNEFQYKVETNIASLTDPSYPSYIYKMKEVKVTLRGPLDDSGNSIARTQDITIKVWRPVAPAYLDSTETAEIGETIGGIY